MNSARFALVSLGVEPGVLLVLLAWLGEEKGELERTKFNLPRRDGAVPRERRENDTDTSSVVRDHTARLVVRQREGRRSGSARCDDEGWSRWASTIRGVPRTRVHVARDHTHVSRRIA